MPTITVRTISLTGSPDYSTLQSWEDASPADLTTSIVGGEIWQGEISLPGDVFTGSVKMLTMSGTTTSINGYKHLTTAAGASFRDHDDVDTNPLRYDSSKGASITTSHQETVLISEAHSRISNIQIETTNTVHQGYALRLNSNAQASNCILSSNGMSANMPLRSSGGIAKFCYAEQRASAATYISRIGSASQIYNCTFIVPDDVTPATTGIRGTYGASILENVAVFGCVNFSAGTSPTCTTCASDGASPPTGVTTQTYDETTGSGFLDIDESTRNYQIGVDSALIDAGTYDAAIATSDIVGTAIGSGTTPIGCWQYLIIGGSSGNPYYYYAQTMR